MIRKILSALMAVTVLTFAGPLLAQDGNLARSFKITPLPGHDAELAAAMASHVQWRQDNNDPWGWGVYQQTAGDDLNSWFVRSPGHTWADLDAYDTFSQSALAHWNSNVLPHVASVSGAISEFIPELSHWPDDAPDFKIFNVISYEIKAGQAPDFRAAAQAITDLLKAAEWDEKWSFIEHLSGPTPGFALVIPEANWAGFEPSEKDVFDIVAEATDPGTAAEMFAAYSATLKKGNSTYYRINDELSYDAPE